MMSESTDYSQQINRLKELEIERAKELMNQMETEIRQDLKTGKSISGGTEHILIVDDEYLILELTKKILEKLGYTVTSRNSGTKALKTFRENPDTFDLLITDLTMPGMKGTELIARVLEIRPGFPVILYSGFGIDITKEKEAHNRIRAYIKKPAFTWEIAETIREVLDNELIL
jgi:CheY-like chemotaxis protein